MFIAAIAIVGDIVERGLLLDIHDCWVGQWEKWEKKERAHDRRYSVSSLGRRRDGGSLSKAGSCRRRFGGVARLLDPGRGLPFCLGEGEMH